MAETEVNSALFPAVTKGKGIRTTRLEPAAYLFDAGWGEVEAFASEVYQRKLPDMTGSDEQ